MEDVREADWSPDGAALAIVHDLGNGRDRLEYPVGTRLHEASGYLSDQVRPVFPISASARSVVAMPPLRTYES